MQGILTFTSLAEAIRAGYQVEDRLPCGYRVKTQTGAGWAYAIVDLKGDVA